MAHSLLRNTAYLTAASVGQKLISFGYFILFARTLNTEQTGLYFLTLSLLTIFSVGTDLGLTSVVIRDTAKYPDRASVLVRHALALKLPLALLSVGVSFLTAYLIYGSETPDLWQQLIPLLGIGSFILFFDGISLLYYGLLRGKHILSFEAVGLLLSQGISAIIGFSFLLFAPAVPWMIVALACGSIFNASFAAIQAARQLDKTILLPLWDASAAWAMLRVALPFALAAIFVKVYSYIDSIFLSKFIGTEAVAVYGVAYKLTYAFQFIPLAFVAALYPRLSHLIANEKERVKEVMQGAFRYLTLLGAPIVFGIAALAPDIVRLAGHGYMSSAPVLRILVFVLLPIFLDFPIGSLLNASDRQGTKTSIFGVVMGINVISNFILIPLFGVTGAAMAAILSFYSLFFLGLIFLRKLLPQTKLQELLGPSLRILLSGAFMGAGVLLARPFIGFFASVPLGAVLFLVGLSLTRSWPTDLFLLLKRTKRVV
ncbi:flippase [Candidatus Uhrbacteria bacterium]|nr:flippase [Candidatus Uhrbacteria bacterium]